ncbi:Gfd1p Ecym_2681 [Eremothecium cymbalariae DBVPG|uniref:Uncharacterized protein n=1 Tax=Eremothecium cymbalariae (strain CBS 270.75 / DBVPG 7215 / KCTC 17166 / NRRL Y-17582) TaxID=931890 RepID=G8JNW6_ERECY|nr:Hypothetical protein Ecym_2681 [Eremothecium cymbalariae DBVPG\
MPLDSKWATAAETSPQSETRGRKASLSNKKYGQRNGGANPMKWSSARSGQNDEPAHIRSTTGKLKSRGTEVPASSGSANSVTSDLELSESRPSTGGSDLNPRNRIFDRHVSSDTAGAGRSGTSEENDGIQEQKPNPLAVVLGLAAPSSTPKERTKRRHNHKPATRHVSRTHVSEAASTNRLHASNALAARLGFNADAKDQSDVSGHDKDERPSKGSPLRTNVLKKKIEEQKRMLEEKKHKALQKQILDEFLCDECPLEWDESELVGQLDRLQFKPGSNNIK